MKSLLGMRIQEMRFRFFIGHKYKRMVQAKKRFALCQNRKSRRQMRREIRLCRSFWGCYPLHYFRYNLYRSDCRLSDEDLVDFIPEFFFYQLFLAHYDSKEYEILLTDKAITEQLFRSLGIAQPPTLAKLVRARLFSAAMEPLRWGDLVEALDSLRPPKVFVKPVDGMGGFGILVFGRDERGEYRLRDGRTLDGEFLARIGREKDYIIQPGLEQDPQIAEIYPHSVNTFRILTENLGGEARVLLANLRIGRAGLEVDNSAQENLILPVDAATGETGAFAAPETGERFTAHPDTGFLFQGARIQRWREIMEFTIAAAQKLQQFTYLGWDIALTRDGPVAIETNLNFGLEHYQAVRGGIRRILGIEDPLFYWRNRGKR
jgi:hypothetical protein